MARPLRIELAGGLYYLRSHCKPRAGVDLPSDSEARLTLFGEL